MACPRKTDSKLSADEIGFGHRQSSIMASEFNRKGLEIDEKCQLYGVRIESLDRSTDWKVISGLDRASMSSLLGAS
jgi:hypothetical protein